MATSPPIPRRPIDVAIVGGGILGLSTAWSLREAGASVVLLDPAPGTGHSSGAGRMFRHAHRTLAHSELALRASALWDELAGRLSSVDAPLIARIGALHTMGGRADLRPLEASMAACEADFEILESAEMRRRWPALAIEPPVALLDPNGGRIDAAAAIRGLLHDLRGVVAPVRVRAIRPARTSTCIDFDGGRLDAGAVVVCAGLETRHLTSPLGIDIVLGRPLTATRLTFRAEHATTPEIPCVHERSGQLGEPMAYFFPGEWGGISLGVQSLPEMLTSGVAARIRRYLEGALLNLDWRLSDEIGARFEVLDDADHDRIEVHRAGSVWAIAGWNLFKHAPAVGEGFAALIAGRHAPLLDALPGRRSSDPA